MLGSAVNLEAPSRVIPEDTSELTLRMLAMLDPAEKEAFQPTIKEALDQIEASDIKTKRERRLREKLAGEGIEAAPVVLKPPQAKAAAPAEASGSGIRASRTRTRAPIEFTTLLPDVPGLYFHWEKTRVVAVFKQISDYQRTKTKSFDKEKSFRSMMAALCTVFEFVGLAYHAKCSHLREYDAGWRVPESHQLENALRALQDRLRLAGGAA